METSGKMEKRHLPLAISVLAAFAFAAAGLEALDYENLQVFSASDRMRHDQIILLTTLGAAVIYTGIQEALLLMNHRLNLTFIQAAWLLSVVSGFLTALIIYADNSPTASLEWFHVWVAFGVGSVTTAFLEFPSAALALYIRKRMECTAQTAARRWALYAGGLAPYSLVVLAGAAGLFDVGSLNYITYFFGFGFIGLLAGGLGSLLAQAAQARRGFHYFFE